MVLHKNKFEWLIKIKNRLYTEKIKPIEFVSEINNKGVVTAIKQKDKVYDGSKFNILVVPQNFPINDDNPLDRTKDGWFINLTNTIIPQEVSGLLQLGKRFSLPDMFDRKSSIMAFIKDIETYTNLHTFEIQHKIRDLLIPEFHNFIRQKTLKSDKQSRHTAH